MDVVLAKLKILKEQIPDLKAKGVQHRDSQEFEAWREGVKKWLAVGGPATAGELKKVQYLHFVSMRIRMRPGYGSDDAESYQGDLQTVDIQLASAIENLEMGLSVPQEQTSRQTGIPNQSIKINANNVIVGDHGQVTINNSITIAHLFKALEGEVEKHVTDQTEKRSLVAKLKDFASHPMTVGITTQAVGELLKNLIGS